MTKPKYKIGMYIKYLYLNRDKYAIERIIAMNSDQITTEIVSSPFNDRDITGTRCTYLIDSVFIEPYPEYAIYKEVEEFLNDDDDTGGLHDV